MTLAEARLKRAVRAGIELCGGAEGVGMTIGRSRATVYEWGNRDTDAFPPLHFAFAMDEIALAKGLVPPILHALSSELTHVAVRLPFAVAGEDTLTRALIDVSAEFGAIAAEVREATRDGVIDRYERDAIVLSIDKAVSALARMRAVVRAPETLTDRSDAGALAPGVDPACRPP